MGKRKLVFTDAPVSKKVTPDDYAAMRVLAGHIVDGQARRCARDIVNADAWRHRRGARAPRSK